MSAALAAVFYGPNQPLELQKIPLPQLQEQEVLVKITSCTLCGSDLHSHSGKRSVPTPTILGHEILGEIVSFGPGTPPLSYDHQELNKGDRITWSIIAHCRTCHYCTKGIPQKCSSLFKYGHEIVTTQHAFHGGLATHCHLTKNTPIFLAPTELADEVLCPANCATATVMAAISRAHGCKHKKVLVQGCGMLGLTACCVAKTQGAQLVIAVDIDPSRLELARTFGADHCVLINDKEQQLTDIPKIDLALEFSGAEQSMKQGLEALNIGGSYVLAGAVFPGPKLQAAGEQIIRKMLSIYGVHNYSPRDLQDAILFLKLQSKNYPFQQLISKKFSLENIHEAFLFAKEETPLRVMIKP